MTPLHVALPRVSGIFISLLLLSENVSGATLTFASLDPGVNATAEAILSLVKEDVVCIQNVHKISRQAQILVKAREMGFPFGTHWSPSASNGQNSACDPELLESFTKCSARCNGRGGDTSSPSANAKGTLAAEGLTAQEAEGWERPEMSCVKDKCQAEFLRAYGHTGGTPAPCWECLLWHHNQKAALPWGGDACARPDSAPEYTANPGLVLVSRHKLLRISSGLIPAFAEQRGYISAHFEPPSGFIASDESPEPPRILCVSLSPPYEYPADLPPYESPPGASKSYPMEHEKQLAELRALGHAPPLRTSSSENGDLRSPNAAPLYVVLGDDGARPAEKDLSVGPGQDPEDAVLSEVSRDAAAVAKRVGVDYALEKDGLWVGATAKAALGRPELRLLKGQQQQEDAGAHGDTHRLLVAALSFGEERRTDGAGVTPGAEKDNNGGESSSRGSRSSGTGESGTDSRPQMHGNVGGGTKGQASSDAVPSSSSSSSSSSTKDENKNNGSNDVASPAEDEEQLMKELESDTAKPVEAVATPAASTTTSPSTSTSTSTVRETKSPKGKRKTKDSAMQTLHHHDDAMGEGSRDELVDKKRFLAFENGMGRTGIRGHGRAVGGQTAVQRIEEDTWRRSQLDSDAYFYVFAIPSMIVAILVFWLANRPKSPSFDSRRGMSCGAMVSCGLCSRSDDINLEDYFKE